MKEPRYRPLATRLIGAILAWSLLMSLALSAVVGWWAHKEASTQLHEALLQQGQALAGNLSESVWSVEPEAVT
eukprot:gene23625-44178_t